MAKTYQRGVRFDEENVELLESLPEGSTNRFINALIQSFKDWAETRASVAVQDEELAEWVLKFEKPPRRKARAAEKAAEVAEEKEVEPAAEPIAQTPPRRLYRRPSPVGGPLGPVDSTGKLKAEDAKNGEIIDDDPLGINEPDSPAPAENDSALDELFGDL